MKLATIEFARNVAGLSKANSEEIDTKSKDLVIHLMESQKLLISQKRFGGTIRLGAYPCLLAKNTLIKRLYGQSKISERHRHRYEFNNHYRPVLASKGLVISGLSPDGNLVEAIELSPTKHPFFLGTQFHPEFKSRPLDPHPIFIGFIKACLKAA